MSDAPEIPADLIALQRACRKAEEAVDARVAAIEQAEAEDGRPELPTAYEDEGHPDPELAALRAARSDARAAVRARVQEVAGEPSRYWTVRAALLAATETVAA